MRATWVFGYGSILWKPEFPYVEATPAVLHGYARRFWQHSPDHRGTPEAPGRVVTLVAAPQSEVWGKAFRVAPEHTDEVFARLDHREQGGYERIEVGLRPVAAPASVVAGIVYVAGRENPCYAGDAPLGSIAQQIAGARGKSGANRDYVFALAEVLREHGVHEPHVFELERLVRQATAA